MFNQLETFKMVYEVQNFSLAAKQLFIAQPTVSTHIQQLEKYFGQTLFKRNGRQIVQPTPAAHHLYLRVNHLLDDWRAITEVMMQIQPGVNIRLRIGASQTVAIYKLPKVLKQLTTHFKNVALEVQMGNSDTILKAIDEHKLDFGFIEKPIITKGIKRYNFGTDQLVRAGDLHSDTWLVREEGSGVGYYTRMFLQNENIRPKHLVQVASNEIIVQMLKQNMGQTILSKEATLANGLPNQVLPETYQRQFYLLCRDHLSEDYQDIERFLLTYTNLV